MGAIAVPTQLEEASAALKQTRHSHFVAGEIERDELAITPRRPR
jgi:hypothetical protein